MNLYEAFIHRVQGLCRNVNYSEMATVSYIKHALMQQNDPMYGFIKGQPVRNVIELINSVRAAKPMINRKKDKIMNKTSRSS